MKKLISMVFICIVCFTATFVIAGGGQVQGAKGQGNVAQGSQGQGVVEQQRGNN